MNIMNRMIHNAITRQAEVIENWLVKHAEHCRADPNVYYHECGAVLVNCPNGHGLELVTVVSTSLRSVNGPYSITRSEAHNGCGPL